MMINISSPSVIKIIFELPLVQEIVALSAKTLKLSSLVNLTISTLQVILCHSQVIVNWTSGIPNDILGEEDSKLLPFLERTIEMRWILQHIDLVVISRVFFEFINQLLRQVWVLWSCWGSVRWLCLWVNWDLFSLCWGLCERFTSSDWALCFLRA